MDKVGRVVNPREGLIVGLRENALQTTVGEAPVIHYLFTKTQHHSHRTGKTCWHGSLLAHFKDARTTMPGSVLSGTCAAAGNVLLLNLDFHSNITNYATPKTWDQISRFCSVAHRTRDAAPVAESGLCCATSTLRDGFTQSWAPATAGCTFPCSLSL